jgi:hypothetical protein
MKTLAVILPLGFLLLMLLPENAAQGQVLLEENFEYAAGTALTSNGWTAHSSAGTNPITVSSGGLSYSGYLSSGIGNAASLNGDGEDVNRAFGSQSSGALYVAFLVNLTNATTGANGDYFFHLNTAAHIGRVYVKKDNVSGNFAFGLGKAGEGPSFTGFEYSFGTTYLVVLKYIVVSGSSNDAVSLFILSSGVPSTEPSSPTIGPLAPENSDATSLNSVALRQSANTIVLTVDGIRVGLGWADTPLPIQLSSCAASVIRGSDVEVQWKTVSETNNFGFEIHRKRGDAGPWISLGFFEGHGTTISPHSYFYLDRSVPFGEYHYLIKQIDLDGKTEIYPEMEVSVGMEPDRLILAQNYPNPFNPSTTIDFVIPQTGWATMKVYNLLGQEVAMLHEGIVLANKVYSTEFNSFGLPSGVYFYQLRSAGKIETKRMTLMK